MVRTVQKSIRKTSKKHEKKVSKSHAKNIGKSLKKSSKIDAKIMKKPPTNRCGKKVKKKKVKRFSPGDPRAPVRGIRATANTPQRKAT